MPSKYPARGEGRRAPACRECGALAVDGAKISARDLCAECGDRRNAEQKIELVAGHGPHYDEWVRGFLAFARELEASQN